MSVFATLRRKRDKGKGAGTVFVSDAKSEPIFNSTPNLHKINNSVQNSSLKKQKKESTAVFYPEDGEEEDIIREDEEDSGKYSGFGSRRASSAESSEGVRYQKNKGQGSLRHFASMISMFGSLKRTKSSRKMAYGSTQDFDPEKREASEYMRDRALGKIPDSELPPTKSSQNLERSTDSLDKLGAKLSNNMEPGVRSSSGSEEDPLEYRKSETTKSEDETRFDYTATKTEEELKRTKILIQGIKKFNMDPKKGIEFLLEHDILQNTSDDVAKFLKYGEGLSKTAIGQYLGEHVDFNEEVLLAFLDLHDFKDLILVQALREFLWSFRLPGESQKIDRMMEAFAKRYCQSNPGIFSCTDTCYLLSYSIIMLNTTLHNPSVKDKPTVEQFIQMNRDVDCGKSLNKAFLVHSYHSILAEPFKIPPEDANDLVLTFFNPNIEGWLWKQGGYKTWKRRWFILSNNCLYYFKFTTDKSPRGIIPLENVHAKEVSSSKSSELFPFILYKKSSRSMPSDVIKTCKTLSNGTTVLSQYHTITVASINQEERKKWVQSINQNNSSSDFYDVLTMKKRNMELARQQGKRSIQSHKRSIPPKCSERKATPQKPSRKGPIRKHDYMEEDEDGRSHRDQHDSYKTYPTVFSSHASISSGSGIERDSSYGSFSDISRSRSESRILECSHDHDGSTSSMEHDTGSLGSQSRGASLGLEERFIRDVEIRDTRYDLPKKLSVIEESQNQSDRSSSSSTGANNYTTTVEDNANPVTLGYRKLSEEEVYLSTTGAYQSDSRKCDNDNFRITTLPKGRDIENQNRLGNHELSNPRFPTSNNSKDDNKNNVRSASSKFKYSRSGSIESDV